MRADRLLSILLLLQVHGRMTARELAGRLEVSERTIHRDMEALSASGVPVIAERGAGGGWCLPDGYQTRLTGLTQPEIHSLFLGTPFRLLTDLGLQDASTVAFLKLQAALPAAFRQDAAYIRQRIHVDTRGWQRAGEAPTALPVLQDAIWQERQVRLAYVKGDGSTIDRLVEPLGLVAKGNVWYLVAVHEGEFRSYRVSRIGEATVSDQPVTRPEGFDLAAHWAQAQAEFVAALPRHPVVLLAREEAVPRMRTAGHFSRVEQVDLAEVAGWCRVQMTFESMDEGLAFALSFGPAVEVLEPASLRAAVAEALRGALARYGGEALTPESP